MLSGPTKLRHFFILAPCGPILEQGISLKDIQAYFESPSGAEYFAKKCDVVELSPGGILYAPFGHVVIHFAMARITDTELEEGQDKDSKHVKESRAATMKAESKLDPGYLWVWNPLAVASAAALHEPVWRAIRSWNTMYLQKNTEVRVWAERLAVVEAFGKRVGDAGST